MSIKIDSKIVSYALNNQTKGNQTKGNQTKGNQTKGNQTKGNQTKGNQTKGNQIKPGDVADHAHPNTGANDGTRDEVMGSKPYSEDAQTTPPHTANVIQMHETVERPEMLVGSTYKLKSPAVSEHAMYITINDIVLNEGTPHELRRPFEVFINSKNLDHFQWIVALTRIMSAVFRKGGDVTFLVEELRSVFDPRGGYWNKGKFMPSIIAEIGDVIEQHLIKIGMLKSPELDEHQKQLIASKRKALAAKSDATPEANSVSAADADNTFPDGATMCAKCSHKAAIIMDGCVTCLNCGDSKCG